jgi:hypothetical protein
MAPLVEIASSSSGSISAFLSPQSRPAQPESKLKKGLTISLVGIAEVGTISGLEVTEFTVSRTAFGESFFL